MPVNSIHRELGVHSSTPVTFELLAKLVEEKVREQEDLDFKSTLYHPQNIKDREELVKDICAMANTSGGWIICGISDEKDEAREIKSVDLTISSIPDMVQLLETRVEPPIRIDARPHLNAGGTETLVAIKVPHSKDAPHIIRLVEENKLKDRKAFCVPVRRGASTVWLDERGLRRLYETALGNGEEDVVDRTNALNSLARRANKTFNAMAFVLHSQPDINLHGRLDEAVARDIFKTVIVDQFATAQGYVPLSVTDVPMAVGDRKYVVSQNHLRFHAFAEIAFDGSAACAIQIAPVDADANEHRLDTLQPDETGQKHLELAIIEAFNFVTHVRDRLVPAVDATITCTIVPIGGEEIYIRANEGSWLGSLLRPREEAKALESFRPITMSMPSGVSDVDQYQLLQELILEVMNQGGISTIRVLDTAPTEESDS